MKKVDAYIAEDGRIFLTQEEAEQWDIRLEFIAWCEENISSYEKRDEVVQTILEHWEVRSKCKR